MVFNKNSASQEKSKKENSWYRKYDIVLGLGCVAVFLVGLNILLEPKIPPEMSGEFLPGLKFSRHGEAIASNITRKPVQIIRPSSTRRKPKPQPQPQQRVPEERKSDFNFDPNGVAQSNPAINTQAGSQAGMNAGSAADSSPSSQADSSAANQSSSQAGSQAASQANTQSTSQASTSAR